MIITRESKKHFLLNLTSYHFLFGGQFYLLLRFHKVTEDLNHYFTGSNKIIIKKQVF